MRDNPEGELDPAKGFRRCCKKNSPILSCIGKRIREGCDRSNEVLTIHGGRDGEGPILLRKPKETGRKGSCEKDFVKSSGCT